MTTATDQAAVPAGIVLAQALRVADIHPSPTNPRKTFPEAEQAELIESVKRHGVMQPILVRPWPEAYAFEGERPKYELIAGERRYRAAKAAGLEYIPATLRDLDDHETLELQIVENLHRKDLNELEEAEGYELMTKQYGYSAEQLADKIGKSKAYIYARMKLTAACEKARQAFRDRLLDASRLLLIARIATTRLQEKALEEITHWEYLGTYRAAANHIQNHYMLKLAEAPFPRDDGFLLLKAGTCEACTKRTGNNPELYPDVKSGDVCTDPQCYADKKANHFMRKKAEARELGFSVIDGPAARKLMPDSHSPIKDYVKLDAKYFDAAVKKNGQYPTYREVLANSPIPSSLIESPDGDLVEVVPEKEFKAVATRLGIRKESNGPSAEEKEREAKAQAETEFRQRLFGQIRKAIMADIQERGANLEESELRLVARQFFACMWHESKKHVARLWVETDDKIDEHERINRLAAQIDTMTPAGLCLLLIDLSLIGMSRCGPYETPDTPAILLNTATNLGISADTLRREIEIEKEAKGKGGKAAKLAEPEQPGAAEVQPETAKPDAYTPAVGDRVRIKQGSDPDLEATGHIGKTGTITQVANSVVPGKVVFYVQLDEDEEISSYADELEKTAAEPIPTPSKLAPAGGDVGGEEADQAEADDDGPADGPAPETTSTPSKAAPAGGGKAGRVEVLYRHPDNPDLAWTGRGRQPKWVEHWLANGGTLEGLLARKRPKHKPRQTQIVPHEKPTGEEPPQRCDKTLELPGLDIEMNATPTATATPAAATTNHAALQGE